MLEFLRRKDKRRPQAQEQVAIPSYQPAAKPQQSSQPLRERNPPPPRRTSSAQGGYPLQKPAPAAPAAAYKDPVAAHPDPLTTRRQNARLPAQRKQKHAVDKENAAAAQRVPAAAAATAGKHADLAHQESRHRWGKRQHQQPAAQASAQPHASAVAAAHDQKKKRNRRLKNKHEPAVLAKSVTSDRRRSIKVAPTQTTAAGAAKQPGAAAAPKRQQQPQPQLQPQQQQRAAATPVAASSAAVARPAENAASQYAARPAATQTDVPPQPTWPHVDLAALLKTGEVSQAHVPVHRVALAATRDNATRLKMTREGVASSIVSLIRHADCTLDMRRDATFAIAELAVFDACEDHLVAAGSIPVLVWLINPSNNPEKQTLGSACRALRNLLGGKETTAVLAAKYGCVEPLLSIVASRSSRTDDPEIVVEAVAAVSNLMHHGHRFQSYVIKHSGLSALTALGSQTDNDEAMFHVVNVLAECAKEARWHKLIVSAEGLSIAFRALRNASDPEVVSEASRLIGNVAVTHKARSAVREAGGLVALIERLNRCKSFKDGIPAFDIVRALANVCADPRAASDALSQKDGAAVLLYVYTAKDAPEKLYKTAFRALQVLAHGSATRRAKVLYSIGIQVKQAAMAGLPSKRLYDLRQAILEDVEVGDRQAVVAMPESLERLSRASVRMINSGVINHNQGIALMKRGSALHRTEPGHGGGVGDKARRSGEVDPARRKVDAGRDDGKDRGNARVPGHDANVFKSTGRVVSVTHRNRPKAPMEMRQLAEGRVDDDNDAYNLPQGSEEAKVSDAELRSRMLQREADGNMTQDFFELGQVLGKGGYGSVFMAKDIRTGELVAIKRFHNSGALVDKKAVKEQNIWKGLHHSNIVEFKGSFVGDNGSLNLVVEYVNGLSLAEHLSQYSAFPETLVAEIARQVLYGLKYLHQNGVTHRDLKPANILVDNNAAVKICDFGVSRSENVQTINPGQQHMVGTPWYIAPEMVEYRPYTTSVDVWSLGCTVLELATGRRPYHELSAMQVLFRMVEDRCPPIPSHISPEAKSFLKSCWVWDPQERPSADDLLGHPFIQKAQKFSDSSKQSSSGGSGNASELGSC